jgi:predicted TIM-barrel fold metal-dependent hydrolase
MAERDRMIERNPGTTWIIAHMSWYGNDLGRLGELFDKYPNTVGELGAVLYDFGRQPRFAREFFEKYSDRILFGKDSFQPAEYPYYWRVFETNDEYFDYYRDYHAFWKLYGMGLSDDLLRKVYYQNAVNVIPGLPTEALPGN